VIFPWGVDLGHFTPEGDRGLRAGLGWEKGYVLLSTRSWEPLYGTEVLVRGFAAAAKREDRLRLIMLGSGSLKQEVRGVIARAGLEDRVQLPGQVRFRDLPGYYRAADLYVSASRSDGTSISLLEAMACGRPVLVSDLPANREWVQPDQNGWLFRSGSVEDMRDKILGAVANREMNSALGERARRIAELRADWRENKRHLQSAYERAVAGEGGGG
jgi:glycosyltransferase involved in cell wall biosynthesis